MQTCQICQEVQGDVIYILCMIEKQRKPGSVDGCFPTSHIHDPHSCFSLTHWVTGTETFSSTCSVSHYEEGVFWAALHYCFTILLIGPSSTLLPFLSHPCDFTFVTSHGLVPRAYLFSSSVFVCLGYDGWYLPRAVHGDELPERRPGSRSPRQRRHASQGPWSPPCWSTQVSCYMGTHTGSLID